MGILAAAEVIYDACLCHHVTLVQFYILRVLTTHEIGGTFRFKMGR